METLSRTGAALIFLLAASASAQEMPPMTAVVPHDHSGVAGQFYKTWNKPHIRKEDGSRYVSCCSATDCGPVQIVVRDGVIYAKGHFLFPNDEIEIPRQIIESNHSDARESPDGLNHACLSRGYMGIVQKHCMVLGSGT